MNLAVKKRICEVNLSKCSKKKNLLREQILSFYSRPFSDGRQNKFYSISFVEIVFSNITVHIIRGEKIS